HTVRCGSGAELTETGRNGPRFWEERAIEMQREAKLRASIRAGFMTASSAAATLRAMTVKLRWLALVGTIVLAAGLYLAFGRQAQYYPGLVIVVGCVTLVLFGLANHDPWGDRKR